MVVQPTQIPLLQQLQPCFAFSDAYALPIKGSETLRSASFDFNNLTTTATFLRSSPRIFANTQLNTAAQFGLTATNADLAFSIIERLYPECLLQQDKVSVCPLLTEDGEYLYSTDPR